MSTVYSDPDLPDGEIAEGEIEVSASATIRKMRRGIPKQ